MHQEKIRVSHSSPIYSVLPPLSFRKVYVHVYCLSVCCHARQHARQHSCSAMLFVWVCAPARFLQFHALIVKTKTNPLNVFHFENKCECVIFSFIIWLYFVTN